MLDKPTVSFNKMLMIVEQNVIQNEEVEKVGYDVCYGLYWLHGSWITVAQKSIIAITALEDHPPATVRICFAVY